MNHQHKYKACYLSHQSKSIVQCSYFERYKLAYLGLHWILTPVYKFYFQLFQIVHVELRNQKLEHLYQFVQSQLQSQHHHHYVAFHNYPSIQLVECVDWMWLVRVFQVKLQTPKLYLFVGKPTNNKYLWKSIFLHTNIMSSGGIVVHRMNMLMG